MKYLRLIQAGYETYSGPIGKYEFENGVSTTLIPRNDRDQLATAFQFVEFEEGGPEEFAGPAQRLVTEAMVRADVVEPLQRQTDEEKQVEDAMNVLLQEPKREIYTFEQLGQIADKKGISGLREVAKIWNVKHREIPKLISLILEAQNVWLTLRQQEFERRGVSEEEFLKSMGVVEEGKAEPVGHDPEQAEQSEQAEQGTNENVTDAAASGDMSAALNGGA